jgi:2-keto-4-pentenoate hydratase/2-oxohepta-3-ene-1,7-dioic acid hydratase in catechol pathway
LDSLRDHIEKLAGGPPGIPITDVRLNSPIANPGKIIAAPVNYRRHLQGAREDPGIHHSSQIAEIERAGLFLKATSSVIGPSEAITLRHPDRRTDHEIELAVVIGKKADQVEAASSLRIRGGLLHRARHHRSWP